MNNSALPLCIFFLFAAAARGQCPVGEEQRGVGCVPCTQGNVNRVQGEGCRRCPFGGWCPGGSTLEVLGGFWKPLDVDAQFPDPYTVIKCEPGACCVAPENSDQSVVNMNHKPCNASSKYRCKKGFAGVLCLSCAEKYAHFGNQCLECSDKSFYTRKSFWLYVAAPFFVASIFCGIAIHEATIPGTGFFFIAIDFVQLVTVIVLPLGVTSRTTDVAYNVLLTAGGGGSSFISEIMSCPMNWDQYIGSLAWTYFGFACLAASIVLVALSKCIPKTSYIEMVQKALSSAKWRVYTFTYLFCVLPGISQAFCVDIGNERRLSLYPFLKCAEYPAVTLVLSLIGWSMALGVPFYVFAKFTLLEVEYGAIVERAHFTKREPQGALKTFKRVSSFIRIRKRRTRSKVGGDATMRRKEKNELLQIQYGFLFRQYRSKYRLWYGPFVLLRRAAFLVTYIASLGSTTNIGQFVLFMMSILSLIGEILCQPYIKRVDRYYSCFSMLSLALIAFVMMSLKGEYNERLLAEAAQYEQQIADVEFNQRFYSNVALGLLVQWFLGSSYVFFHQICMMKSKRFRRFWGRIERKLMKKKSKTRERGLVKLSSSKLSRRMRSRSFSFSENSDDGVELGSAKPRSTFKTHATIHSRMDARSRNSDAYSTHEPASTVRTNFDEPAEVYASSSSGVVESVLRAAQEKAESVDDDNAHAQDSSCAEVSSFIAKAVERVEYMTPSPAQLQCL